MTVRDDIVGDEPVLDEPSSTSRPKSAACDRTAGRFDPFGESPMKILVALMVAVFAMSALVGCKAEVDKTSSSVAAPR